MPKYGQYCPVSQAADILGDRWTLLIMREMVGGSTRFNELERALPRISRSLLAQRLRQLTRTGIVKTVPLPSARGNEYHLTAAGRDLEPVLLTMGHWAARWILDEPREENLDPTFLMWWIHRRVNLEAVPAGRTVVRFDVVDPGREVYWIVLTPGEVSLCMTDPGFDVDVQVTADCMALQRIYAGWTELSDALAAGKIIVDGRAQLVRRWPS
ncbi:MAG: winged helix-turn-helix transcriptional regulator, partial [Actinomycetota bacterium]